MLHMCRYFASVEPSALSAGASASPMGRAGASEVGTALLRTLRYSSGSLVLGALLVAPPCSPMHKRCNRCISGCIRGCSRKQARCW